MLRGRKKELFSEKGKIKTEKDRAYFNPHKKPLVSQ